MGIYDITFFQKNKRMKTSLAATFVLSMVAHAYSYFNSAFATDRFRWFGHYTVRGLHGAAMGKWFGQYLGFLNWNSYLPWLNGLIATTYLAFSVWIVCEVLDVKKTLSIILIAGLMVTDSCVIMANFFTPQGFLLALITACISVYFWHNDKLKLPVRIAGEAVFISFSLGTYGSYTTVAPTLVILACMVMLLQGEGVVKVLKRGGEYIASFLAGMGLYYVILRLCLKFQKIEMLSYLNEDKLVTGTDSNELLYCIEIGYKNSIARYLGDYRGRYRVMPQWMAILMLLCGVAMIAVLVWNNDRMKKNKWSYVLLLALIAVFPLSAGAIYVMAFGTVHHLMVYTYVMLYVGFVKLAEMIAVDRLYKDWRKQAAIIMSGIMIACSVFVVYKGILVSNMCYSRLDNLNTISEGIAFRVLDRIESCEGFTGDEPVCFVGDITDSEYFKNSRYSDSDWLDMLDGIIAVSPDRSNVFIYYTHLIMFMKEYTETDLDIDYYDPDSEVLSAQDKQIIEDMPLFPADGSVRKIGGQVIVKFSEDD